MNVFISRVIPQVGLDLLAEAGISVTQWEEKRALTQDELIDFCKKHDAFLSTGRNKLDERFFKECAHLKVVALLSVGYDNVDVDAATKANIPVGNTPGVLSAATADAAFLLMIATSRKAFYMHKKILNGEWGFYEPNVDLGIELEGKTLGIWGLGRIGFELAKRCIGAYNMKVIYCNRGVNEEAEHELNAKRVTFDELLAQSDVLSIHVSLTHETKSRFNKDTFAKMKPSAIFINAARGGIHNEEDLLEALENNVIWGAGLDVTNPEPMQPDNKLLNMPNVSVLPHIGSATKETRDKMAEIAVKNIIAGLNDKSIPFAINPQVYGDY